MGPRRNGVEKKFRGDVLPSHEMRFNGATPERRGEGALTILLKVARKASMGPRRNGVEKRLLRKSRGFVRLWSVLREVWVLVGFHELP